MSRDPRQTRWAARRIAIAGALVIWIVPALVAWAESEGEQGEARHGDPWMDLVWKAVNFAVLAGVLWYFLRKPVAKALREGAARARQTIDDARGSASAVERRYQDQKRNLENLKTELERLREDARAETDAESERLRKEAESTAQRMSAQIDKQVEQARVRALQSIRAELADEAVKLAETLIKKKLDDAGQRRFLDDRIAKQERLS